MSRAHAYVVAPRPQSYEIPARTGLGRGRGTDPMLLQTVAWLVWVVVELSLWPVVYHEATSLHVDFARRPQLAPLQWPPVLSAKERMPRLPTFSLVLRRDMRCVRLRNGRAPFLVHARSTTTPPRVRVFRLRFGSGRCAVRNMYVAGLGAFAATNIRCGWNCNLRYRCAPALHAQGGGR